MTPATSGSTTYMNLSPSARLRKQIAMADQFRDFMAVLNAFDKHEVDYILIGGVAIILHGMERLTRDVDIFVKMNAENIDKLREALHSIFDDTSIDEITLEELNKYPVILMERQTVFVSISWHA